MTITRTPAGGGLPFSKAVAVRGQGEWIYLAGQLGLDAHGTPVAGGVDAEARQAFARLLEALRQVGGTADHVIKISASLTSLDQAGEYVAVIREVFGDQPPASTTVQVAGLLLGAHVEIDAVAFIPA